MAIIKIDGFDLWQYTRVNPGDGMDLADQDFIDPQFTSSATGFGDELISVQMKNRELVVPVHMKGASKDALHSLVSSLNRRLAVAKMLEWADDGATASSYLKIQFARFEPEFNKRRQDAGIMSGVVRIYTEPYAKTVASGYSSVIPSFSAGTGIVASRDISAYINGDGPMSLKFTVNTPSVYNSFSQGRLLAGAVLPASYVSDWSAASLVPMGSTTLVGASGAVGSQTLAHQSYGLSFGPAAGTMAFSPTAWVGANIARLILTNASAYAGNNRVLAITAANFEIDVLLVDPTGEIPVARSVATVHPMEGLGVADLGIVNINPTKNGATHTLTFATARRTFTSDFLSSNGTIPFELNRIILLPEDTSFFIVDDSRRRPLALIEPSVPSAPIRFDSYGQTVNVATGGNPSQYMTTWPENPTRYGWLDFRNATVGWTVAATSSDITADAHVYWTNLADGAGSIAFDIGKQTRFGAYTARYYSLNGSTQAALQIAYIAPDNSASCVACVGIPGLRVLGAASAMYDFHHIRFRQQGPALSAEIYARTINYPVPGRGVVTSFIAATVSASIADAAVPGLPFTRKGQGLFMPAKLAWSTVPSTGLSAGDVYTISSDDRRATRMRAVDPGVSGNVFDVGYGLRGDFLQFPPATKYAAAVAYLLPVDRSGGVNQLWSAAFELAERFTYSK